MPEVFSKYHDDILRNWGQKGVELSINKFKRVWVLDGQGYCVSCRLYVKVLPDYEGNSYQLLGFIQRFDNVDCVVLDSEGEVSSFSKNFGSMIGLVPKQLKDHFLNVQLLCPELLSTFKIVGQELPRWGGATPQSFMFSIPIDLLSMLKSLTFKKQNLFNNAGLDIRNRD